jgi:hypothetical protein
VQYISSIHDMFAIVEWLDSKQVSAVPLKWLVLLEGELWSFWTSSAADTKALRNASDPKGSWSKYRVRQIGKEGNTMSCNYSK